MNNPVLLALAATGLACAGPTAEIATDGIRLGWRFTQVHPFVRGELDIGYESSSYRRTLGDSVVADAITNAWYTPSFSLGAGVDWLVPFDPISCGLRTEASLSPHPWRYTKGFVATIRSGPLLEKRWDRFIVGGSWAPRLEWTQNRYDESFSGDGVTYRTIETADYLDLSSSTELHVRWEF